MAHAQAVIGASYGDEGKGRMVDFLAAPFGETALVVRSNGGAQAGHTVVGPDGARHVFHHFGSGTLRGARTHLSRFMVSHPMLFRDEFDALAARGATPQVSLDPHGYVTTPWDMMLNQTREIARGSDRHESCGLGFGETVGRNEESPFGLSVGDLFDTDLAAKLRPIRDEWLPMRLEASGLTPDYGPLEFAHSAALFENYIAQCRFLAEHGVLREDETLGGEEALIFEAAQGLLLDRHGDDFPFVTRSNTGLANIVAIAEMAGIDELEANYVTRAYLTRHGAGPMEDERDIARWYAVDDPTNRPNRWQETLRIGLLDPAKLAHRINCDLNVASGKVAIEAAIALTCLDQASGLQAWLDAGLRTGSEAGLIDAIEAATALPVRWRFNRATNGNIAADRARAAA